MNEKKTISVIRASDRNKISNIVEPIEKKKFTVIKQSDSKSELNTSTDRNKISNIVEPIEKKKFTVIKKSDIKLELNTPTNNFPLNLVLDDEKSYLFMKYFIYDILHDFYKDYEKNQSICLTKYDINTILSCGEKIFFKDKKFTKRDALINEMYNICMNIQCKGGCIFREFEMNEAKNLQPEEVNTPFFEYYDTMCFMNENYNCFTKFQFLENKKANEAITLPNNRIKSITINLKLDNKQAIILYSESVNNINNVEFAMINSVSNNTYLYATLEKFKYNETPFDLLKNQSINKLTEILFKKYIGDFIHYCTCIALKEISGKIVRLKTKDSLLKVVANKIFGINVGDC